MSGKRRRHGTTSCVGLQDGAYKDGKFHYEFNLNNTKIEQLSHTIDTLFTNLSGLNI